MRLTVFACATLAFTGTIAHAQTTTRTVALQGEPAPGTDAGIVFENFRDAPHINRLGAVAFLAELAGPDVDILNAFGTWTALDNAPPTLLARSGEPAPGGNPDESLFNLRIAAFNDAGTATLAGSVATNGVGGLQNGALWTVPAGGIIDEIAREDAPAAGTGVLFNLLSSAPALNNTGDVAFGASLKGEGVTPSNSSGVWSRRNDAPLALIVRRDDQAPGTPPNVRFTSFDFPNINHDGHTAFYATLRGQGIDTLTNHGIWSERGGQGLALVYREGDQVPGAAPGVAMRFEDNAVFNARGDFAVVGDLRGAGIAGDPVWCILSDAGGNGPELFVRGGDPVPGLDASFVGFGVPALSNTGGTAFIALIEGPDATPANEAGLWSRDPDGALELIAIRGTRAPGTEQGVQHSTFSDIAMTTTGRIAFMGGLQGTGIGAHNNRALFAQDAAGTFRLVAREGDPFDVDDDPANEDLRTIADRGIHWEPEQSFNDAGEIALALEFTDGNSGVFIVTLGNKGAEACPGDFDNDQDVDLGDFGVFGAAFDSSLGDANYNAIADFDGDQDVDLGDFGAFGAQFGRTDCGP